MMSTPSANATVAGEPASVSQRVAQAREWMQQVPGSPSAGQPLDEFAWIRWGNLPMPMWNNWPNWHNWHNWPNWPNY